MILFIVISVLIVFLLWILFGPLIIRIDSENHTYSLSLPGIFKASAVPDDDLFYVRARIFFIPVKIKPFNRTVKESKPVKRKQRDLTKSFQAGMMALKELVQSFSMKALRLNIDTDDFTLNSQLVPVFSVINTSRTRMTVNYQGDTSIYLILKNRMASLIWIGIKFLYRIHE